MRIQSLNIGEAVRELLVSSSDVTALVGTKVSPVVAKESVTFPYITYTNTSLVVNTDKDSIFYQEIAQVAVVVCTDTYKAGVDIAAKVVEALQHRDGVTAASIDIVESMLVARTESYVNNTFAQGLVFEFHIQ